MIRQIRTCDHCGAETKNKFTITLCPPFARNDAQCHNDEVDGCSYEHTVLAMAKILGIGVDGRCAGIITAKDLEISRLLGVAGSHLESLNVAGLRIADLEKQINHLNRSLDEKSKLISADATRAVLENERLQSRMYNLKKQLAAANERPPEINALQQMRDKIAEDGAKIWEGDKSGLAAIATSSAMIDAHIASITEQTKPTKPLRDPTIGALERAFAAGESEEL